MQVRQESPPTAIQPLYREVTAPADDTGGFRIRISNGGYPAPMSNYAEGAPDVRSRRANPMGLYLTLAGIALFTIAVFLDWLATDIEDTERVGGASVSGYETDSLIPFVAYVGIGLAAALLYAMTRAHRRQHRGLTLTSMAVGIAATLLALSYLIDAPGVFEGARDLSPEIGAGSPSLAGCCGPPGPACSPRRSRATTTWTTGPTDAAAQPDTPVRSTPTHLFNGEGRIRHWIRPSRTAAPSRRRRARTAASCSLVPRLVLGQARVEVSGGTLFLAAAHPWSGVWLSSGVRSCRPPLAGRGSSQGSARLEEALPSPSTDRYEERTGRRDEAGGHRYRSA